ncbi:MAG: HAD family hydrolase [Phycisphaerae bacterium]
MQPIHKVQALILDFDGVVVDSEPIHLACFREVLAGIGVPLATEDYYARYVGFDDHDCFAAVLRNNGREAAESLIRELVARKTALVQQAYTRSVRAMPGAVELIRGASEAGVPTAVCSGGLRKEIEIAARAAGVAKHLLTVVTAEDVRHGKPDPEGYRLALARLCAITGKALTPGRCVVVEDAPAGIQAAKTAGMKVLAVTSSYPAGALNLADRIVASLTDVSLGSLAGLAE